MKTLFAKKNLFIRVAIGFVLGVLLGFIAPKFSISTKVVGDIYLNLIKMMIIPLVMCAVFCGIANIRDGALLRKIGVRTVALYVLLFIVSAVLMSKCMDRDKRREAQEGRYGADGKHSPDAAFDFDDNEPTVDDIKNDPKE